MSKEDKKTNDLDDLKNKLSEIKNYYKKLSALYSIKNDLVEATDRRYALSQQLDDYLNKHQQQYNELYSSMQKGSQLIEDTTKNIDKLKQLDAYFNSVLEGSTQTRAEKLSQIISDTNLSAISSKINQIEEAWHILNRGDEELNLVEDIQDTHNEIIALHNDIFDSKENKKSKATELNDIFDDFQHKYKLAITGYQKTEDGKEISIKSYYNDMKDKLSDITSNIDRFNKFYEKIFISSEEKKSLEEELETRINSLKEIEKEAKKVIDLSSDAGLAGGFVQIGEKAKKSKETSLRTFVYSLTALGIFNLSIFYYYGIEFNLESIITKTIINLPFIWIAIVANINLNKYSRLEEEYAHKESLARSFERYKTEIEKLNSMNPEESKKLLLQLMKTNIEAFALNPAVTMEKAKSDFSIERKQVKPRENNPEN